MVIPIVPLVEYCVMLRDKAEGKRLGDSAAKTRVTDLKPEEKDSTYLAISLILLVLIIAVQVGVGLLMKQNPELMDQLKQ